MNIFLSLLLVLIVVLIKKNYSLNAYIHIGPHKTGSTEMQELIRSNLETFKQYNITAIGFDVFAKAMDIFIRKYLIADDHSEWIDDRIEQIKTSKTDILISSETFDALNKTAIIKLKKLLSGYNVTIIATHRARLSHIHSYWAQTIGMQFNKDERVFQNIKDFSEYFMSTFQFYEHNNVNTVGIGYNFKTVLESYAEVFGYKSIEVISFEGAVLKYNHHPSSLFYALLEEVLDIPVDSFNTGNGKTWNSSYFQMDMLVTINKFNILRGCKFNAAVKSVKAIIDEYETKLTKSSKLVYPPVRFINDDLHIKKAYTYYLAPPIKTFSDPLILEVLCLKSLENNEVSMKTWNELLSKVSVCSTMSATDSLTVTFPSTIFKFLMILFLVLSLFVTLFLTVYKKIKSYG
jgi:hypothetical protein